MAVRQTRPHGFSGDAQDDFVDPPYDPESFCVLDADSIRARMDELAILKFGWPEAYKKVRDYHETMGVVDCGRVGGAVSASRGAVRQREVSARSGPKFLLLDDVGTPCRSK